MKIEFTVHGNVPVVTSDTQDAKDKICIIKHATKVYDVDAHDITLVNYSALVIIKNKLSTFTVKWKYLTKYLKKMNGKLQDYFSSIWLITITRVYTLFVE